MTNLTPSEIQGLSIYRVGLVACGYCPYCEAYIRGYPSEMEATLDASTPGRSDNGHRPTCRRKDFQISGVR